MTDEQKIALYDALAMHFIETLDTYYDVDDVDDDEITDDVPQETKIHSIEFAVSGTIPGLSIEMEIAGWADRPTFWIELPSLARDDQIGE